MPSNDGSTAAISAVRHRRVQVAAVLSVIVIAAIAAVIFFWTLSARVLVVVALVSFAVAVISGLMFASLVLAERMGGYRDLFEDAFADAAIWTVLIGVFLIMLTVYALVQAKDRSHSSPPSTLLTNTVVDEPVNSYLALGDSYSAGEGLGTRAAPYIPPTGDGGNRCHRSAQAYPELLSFPNAKAPVPLVFVACSGAISAQVFDLPQKTGFPVQGDALATKADLVTLTMGGNDLHFSDVLKLCFLKSDCTNKVLSLSGITPGHGEDTTPTGLKLSAWTDKMLPIIQKRLTTVLTTIRAREPDARIVIIGYPHLLPTDSGDKGELECRLVLNSVKAKTRAYIADVQDRFNQAIYEAAAASGVEFVDPAFAWTGHEACGSKGGWINPALVNGTSPGPGSFHPTTAGQVALASILACYLDTHPTPPLDPATSSDLPPRPGSLDAPLSCSDDRG
jgi:lysophospholipase L1-like esterase